MNKKNYISLLDPLKIVQVILVSFSHLLVTNRLTRAKHRARIDSFNSRIAFALGRRYTKPGLQAENRAYHTYKKNNSDDGLSGYTVSSLKAVRHCFCIMVCSGFFFRLPSRLSISWALASTVLENFDVLDDLPKGRSEHSEASQATRCGDQVFRWRKNSDITIFL